MAVDLDETDPFAVTSEGLTPGGGVAMTVYFLDENGQPVRRSLASQAEAVEVDRDGNQISRNYISMNKRSSLTVRE